MDIGNEPRNYQKELSIQISLGGFSFLVETPEGQINGAEECYDFDKSLELYYSLPTIVEWSVPSVLIVPFELFDHRYIDDYLLSAYMLDKNRQRSLFAVRGDFVAVWSVDKELYEYLGSRIEAAEHNHTLLRLLENNYAENLLLVEVDSSSVLHIVLWSQYGLEAAHSVQIKCAEDILFYAAELSRQREVSEPRMCVSGQMDSEVIDMLARYYTLA